tara:strand:+ start:2996 stop:3661 length:666 start_codon:yes stop_codon:yes gene_type:complete
MAKYIDTIYDPNLRPLTNYPDQLANYLFTRFDMKKGEKLLDLGCGRGDFSKAFQRLGLVVEGADIEQTQSEIISDIKLSLFDLEKNDYPYDENSFDYIFSKSVIEHLFDPQNFLNEQKRILKKGGRLIVMAPDWESQIYIFWNDYTHKRPYTVLGLKNTLKIFGFKETNCELFYQLPFYWKNPKLKFIAHILKLTGPVKKLYKNKFYRWSKELMLLATAVK